MEKVYKVKTRFVFEGVFEVKAQSRVEARQMVQDNCGMVLHSGIQTTLEDDVIDWNFSCHPDKKIISVVKQVSGYAQMNQVRIQFWT